MNVHVPEQLSQQILDSANNTFTSLSTSDTAGLLHLLKSIESRNDDVANWPNSFAGIQNSTFQDTGQDWLEFVDGATNGENIPYGPLFVKARGLDVIVTIEGGSVHGQNQNWPTYVYFSLYCVSGF